MTPALEAALLALVQLLPALAEVIDDHLDNPPSSTALYSRAARAEARGHHARAARLRERARRALEDT